MPAAVTQFAMLVNEMAVMMQVDASTILLADSLRAVCLVSGMLFSGVVYQKLGLKRTIALGLFFQILPQFLVPFALDMRSLPFFFLAKGIQGFNSVAFPLYLSTVASWADSRSRGVAIAIFNGSFTAGAGVGAWLSGMIIPAFGWRMSFWFVGFMSLLFAIPALIITKPAPATAQEPEIDSGEESAARKHQRVLKMPATWMLVLTLLACNWVTQAITVDMSVYSSHIGYDYGQTGNMMLLISSASVVFSILGGFVSDRAAARSQNAVYARCVTLAAGYIVSIIASALLPSLAKSGYLGMTAASVCMMAGAAWVQGGFWAIPTEIYSRRDNIVATAICSGASSIVNPIAPIVTGVVLGMRGMWSAAWLTCAFISALSVGATILLSRFRCCGEKITRV